MFPKGQISYSDNSNTRVILQGIEFSEAEIKTALKECVIKILADEEGKLVLLSLFGDLPNSSFEEENIRRLLAHDPEPEDWRVGEAIVEAYLIDHKMCEFPWPSGRDQKNPNSSPAGADLVGFHEIEGSYRFAFGEVKTSAEKKWPPQVVTSRHGLAKQLEDLRNSVYTKENLVLYLGHRATNSSWEQKYKEATSRFVKDATDVSLFGFLVRDVEAKIEDLQKRAVALSKECPDLTTIELHGLYLPSESISNLPSWVKEAKGN
jgi:hypothetical protein